MKPFFSAAAYAGFLAFGLAGQPAEAAPTLAVSHGGVTLTSKVIELPGDTTPFPAGPNLDIVRRRCVACHSPSMVLVQPRLSHAQWQAEVQKMHDVYKASITDSDVAKVVDYLDSLSARLPGQ